MVGDDFAMAALAGAGATVLVAMAEFLHGRRVRRIAWLAFGPRRQPRHWARAAPLLRVVAAGALAWGLTTLLLVPPMKHMVTDAELVRPEDQKHILLVLDVSPSMRLEDAGPKKELSRMKRARAVIDSFFQRVPLELYRISVVATYNGAKAVVVDTSDLEVVRNILGDLPMHYAFPSGETKLFEGLEEAVKIARPWKPKSTTLILLSDGDTVPARGMPSLPASVGGVLVLGVGDPLVGKFIDGRQSRQEVSMLRQIAVRLGGTFHNANEKHISSTVIADITHIGGESRLDRLTRREYALIACALGAALLALLPVLLHFAGTAWSPGVPRERPVARLPEWTARAS